MHNDVTQLGLKEPLLEEWKVGIGDVWKVTSHQQECLRMMILFYQHCGNIQSLPKTQSHLDISDVMFVTSLALLNLSKWMSFFKEPETTSEKILGKSVVASSLIVATFYMTHSSMSNVN